MKKKLQSVGHLFVFIFIVWGLYRLIFRLPENIEEIILKPLIWLIPVLYIVFKIEKRGMESLGYTGKKFGKAIKKGLIFSAVFFLIGLCLNYLKYNGFSFANLPSREVFLPALFLSFITAISEETVFRGYIFNRLNEILKNQLAANLLSSIGFCLVYLPISIFLYHYNLPQAFIFLLLIFFSSLGSGLMFSWTGSIWSSILIHVFWTWPVILAR